jgi:tetratricopeptide (TPR) repeat protein
MFKRFLTAFFGKAPATPSAEAAQQAHDLFDAGDYAAALVAYEALFAATGDPRHLVNGGFSSLMVGDLESARDRFHRAHVLDSGLPQALMGLGDVAARQQAHADAVAWYDKALAIDGELAIARNNRSQSLTALGRLQEAWRDAEARYRTPGARALYPHRLLLPLWDGRADCRLLVHWEQGLGDILQHLRFLPEAARRAGQCSFECPPPLLPVMQGMAGSVSLIPATNVPPDTGPFDFRAPLLSLPYLLQQDPDALPKPPYLQAPEGRAAQVSHAPGDGPRIGVVWRASLFDTRRNLSLASLLDLAARLLPSVRLVSLQKDVTPEEAALLASHGVQDAGSAFADFGDTAAAIRAVDAVVTVDTSVAHLAGALAHPMLLMLNHQPAERWMLTGETTPWYPSAILVRRAEGETEADWIGRGLARVAALVGQGRQRP